MKTNNNIPAYRFQGYTDAWELRKLRDTVIEIIAGGDIDKNKVVEFGKYPIYANSHSGDGIVGYYDDFYRVNGPAVTVTGRGEVGFAKARETDFTPVVRLLAIRSKHNHYFLENAINLHGVTVESTGVPQLTVPQLSAYRIYFPYDIQEENQIGTFFSTLDRHITLHQRKLDTLKEQKKTYLKLLFPAKGQTKPALRFQGFEDDWKEVKLGECIEDYVEKTTKQNQYPVLTSSQNQGIVFQENYFANRQVTTENNIGYFVLPRGYFTYRSRSDNGKFRFNRNDLIDKGIISYFYPVFSIKYGDSNFFLFLLNSRLEKEVDVAAEGTGQRVLALKKFKNISISIPSLPEQEAIGTFFQTLDQETAQVEDKLASLKEMKKTLLRKLFV